jgi:hypothetical protein
MASLLLLYCNECFRSNSFPSYCMELVKKFWSSQSSCQTCTPWKVLTPFLNLIVSFFGLNIVLGNGGERVEEGVFFFFVIWKKCLLKKNLNLGVGWRVDGGELVVRIFTGWHMTQRKHESFVDLKCLCVLHEQQTADECWTINNCSVSFIYKTVLSLPYLRRVPFVPLPITRT